MSVELHYERFLSKLNDCIRHIDQFRILGNAAYRAENLNITAIFATLLEVKSVLSGLYDETYDTRKELEKAKNRIKELENKIEILEALKTEKERYDNNI